MGMIGFHNIRVKSPYNIKIIEDIKIECRLNNHGKLYLKAIIDEKEEFNHAIQATLNDEIHLYEKSGQEERTIFKGLVASAKVKKESNVYHLEIEGISGSFKLDTKQKSRSFQDINKEYAEIAKEVVKDYPQHNFAATIGEDVKIQVPIIQYQETDWELIKRLASKLNSVVVCDIMEKGPRIYFGLPKGKSYTLGEDTLYSAKKDLLAFKKAGGYEEGLHDTDFFTYEIESLSQYKIGDEINFRKKKLYVTEVKGYMEGGILKFKYVLSRKNGIVQREIYNNKIKGMCLEGKILEVKNELVKLHLNIDKTQEKSKAYWFPFSPPTGNVMYCMPKAGTEGTLYFPEATADKANVIGCSRKNGGSCSKTGNPNNRYLGTEHGSELEITPSAINIDSGSKKPLKITIDDNTGITITSHKKLTLNASQNIAFYTPKKVVINAKSQLLAKKKDVVSGFAIESEYHFLGGKVISEGKDRESYPKYNDEPLQGQLPEPKKEEKKKKGFNWGKLAKNVLAGLAVVAVVTVAAVAIAATAGAAAPLIGAIATCAVAGGTAAVASQAISDIRRGEVSDIKAYMGAAARESIVGALSGAVFGPLGAAKTVAGRMAMGGITNAFESIIRQKLEGNGFSLKTMAFDGIIGSLFAGALDTKFFKSVAGKVDNMAPWIAKGMSKFNNKIDDIANKFANKVRNVADDFNFNFGQRLAYDGVPTGNYRNYGVNDNQPVVKNKQQMDYIEATNGAIEGNGLKQYPDGSIRDSKGHFAGKTGTVPGTPGVDKAMDMIKNNAAYKGYDILGTEISVRGADGTLRRYDIVARKPDGSIVGIEVKSGTATRTAQQKLIDNELLDSGGLDTVGDRAKSIGVDRIDIVEVIKVK